MPVKKELSLLSDADNMQSLSSRVLRWTTTIGRVLLIITNLVVIAIFFSRFWLDRRNADLSETLRQQKAIVESTRDFEADFNSLQSRLKFISAFRQKSSPLAPKMINLAQSIPLAVTISSLNVKDGDAPASEVQITASAFDEQSIVDLVTNLMLNPQIKSVEISNIEKKTKTNFFKIVLSLTVTDLPTTNARI